MIARLLRRWFVPRSAFEQVHQALVTAQRLIFKHHEVGVMRELHLGDNCPVCIRNYVTTPEIDKIYAALEVRERL